ATPAIQPTSAEETNQPCWNAESENCSVTNGNTPETTAMSNPNRNPPNAATAQANHRIFGCLRRWFIIVLDKCLYHFGCTAPLVYQGVPRNGRGNHKGFCIPE